MKEISGKPLKGEMELINKYTRRQLGEEEVYAFTVVLCDNEIDRDSERFSDEALEKLSELFVGVTGIADHEPASRNQTSRIFSCRTESVPGKTTSDGIPYRRLTARAYMPRSAQNEEMILALDSGVKKEVSVGCAVKERICSVCGKDISRCEHVKGRKYAGKSCFVTLSEPVDAYEWSFVAVPAQKEAGVVKHCRFAKEITNEKEGGKMELKEKLFSKKEQSFSCDEMEELAKRFSALEEEAQEGRYYRSTLISEVKSLAMLTLPALGEDILADITGGLSARQLNELKKALSGRAEELMPMKPQLYAGDKGKNDANVFYNNI